MLFLTFNLGLTIASLFYEEETVLQVSLASFYPVLLMSGKLIYLNYSQRSYLFKKFHKFLKGVIWPIEAQPSWLKNYVSKYLPLSMASDSFRAILEKGWTITDSQVLKGFLSTYIWTFIFSIIFLVMFSRKFRLQ